MMDFNGAARDIYQRFNGVTTESDIRSMLDDEINHEQARLKAQRPRGRGHYQEAVATAHKRILDWITTADDFSIGGLPSFVAHTRHACVWAVLLGQKLSKGSR